MARIAQGGRASCHPGLVTFNPNTAPAVTFFSRAIQAAAPSFGVTVTLAPVGHDAAIEQTIAAQEGGGLTILPDSFNETNRAVIIAAATELGLPLIGTPQFARAGGLMSYWFDPVGLFVPAAS